MKRPTLYRNHFGKALREIRQARRLSQEAFGLASSRSHVSALERGVKTPGLDTVEQLAEVLEVHPLTLLVLAYAKGHNEKAVSTVLNRVMGEFADLKLE